ncbi:MAG: hypothetical protein KDD73_14530 [Anaerolineales bacterium]|nr:hypothetical protein [Anaerolineales bacterium]
MTLLKTNVSKLPYSWYLIGLWALVNIKSLVIISPLVLDFRVNLGLTLLFVGLLGVTFFHDGSVREQSRPIRFGWLIPLLSIGFIQYAMLFLARYFAHFGYGISRFTLGAVLLLNGILALVILWREHALPQRPPQNPAILLFAALTMSAFLALAIQSFPLVVERSDMLPLIVSANQDFINDINPYHWHHDVGPRGLPLSYLTMTWIVFLPAVMVKIDPRFINLLAHLAFIATLYISLRPTPKWPDWTFLLWMSLNPLLIIRHDIQTYPLWFALALTLLFTIRRRWTLASIGWGLLILWRTTMWVLIPFYLLTLLLAVGWRRTLKQSLLLFGVSVAGIWPFLIPEPIAIYDGVIGFFAPIGQALPTAEWGQIAGWAAGFSAIPVLYRGGIVEYYNEIQIGAVLLIFLVALIKRPPLPTMMKFMTAALLVFLLFNSLVWEYVYGPLLILLTYALLASREAAQASTVASDGPAPESAFHR